MRRYLRADMSLNEPSKSPTLAELANVEREAESLLSQSYSFMALLQLASASEQGSGGVGHLKHCIG